MMIPRLLAPTCLCLAFVGIAPATVLAQEAPVSPEAFNAAQNRYFGKTYDPSQTLPDKTQSNQTGTNNCGTESSPTSLCQNLYLNSATDFCLFSNPVPGIISDMESDGVSYCSKSGRGTRVIPFGTIKSATFVRTPSYVQITGVGDFTTMNVSPGDDGGEYDFGAASGEGNPKGNLVFTCSDKKCTQRHRWMLFLSDDTYCLRACEDGPNSESLCRHTYDRLGCQWNMPGEYISGVFQNCESDDAADVMYHDGVQYLQGDGPVVEADVPAPHPAPTLRNCVAVKELDVYGHLTGDVFKGTRNVKVTPLTEEEMNVPAGVGGTLQANRPFTSDLPPSSTNTSSDPADGQTPVLDGGSSANNGTLTNGTVAGNMNTTVGGSDVIAPNAVVGLEASYRIGLGLLASFLALLAGCILL